MSGRHDDRDCEVCHHCGVAPNHQGGCHCRDDGNGFMPACDGHERLRRLSGLYVGPSIQPEMSDEQVIALVTSLGWVIPLPP